ncbi:MAG: hypothetical protein JKX72_08690 [Robiginitomaculum sp.]|nr:hypothetical protein [Robiginitomaculum sp.]
MKKYKLDVVAVIIALCAVLLSVWQGMATRQHNKLSAMPHLDMSLRGYDGADMRGLRVDNAGLGPAFIKEVTFSYWGEPIVKNDMDRDKKRQILQVVLDRIGWPKDDASRNRILRTSLPAGSVLKSGREIYIFGIATKLSENEFKQFQGLEVKIVYQTIYNDTCILEFDPKLENSYKHTGCN